LEVLHHDPDARSEIATTTIGRSLPKFRKQALVGGGWHYDGGASIPTYFMGAALSVFPNEFRRWRTQRIRWMRQDHCEYTANGLHCTAAIGDPAVVVLGSMRVADDLSRASPRERDIIKLTMAGYQQEEIVELLGETSVRAVQGVLHRWRNAQKKRLEGGDRRGTA
jgi:DNA-directed RNA polymerase specialized sigma24 family protein